MINIIFILCKRYSLIYYNFLLIINLKITLISISIYLNIKYQEKLIILSYICISIYKISAENDFISNNNISFQLNHLINLTNESGT